ncbi:MAG TPA: Hsp20/alpha crystallin family protein [Gemmatimonadaceae bacterium]|nr:Hsp20/alpha crystallin family protein [Gemmatimonadaceae bacterium]
MLYRTSLSAPVFGLRREIDRLFEDTFGRGEGMTAWNPAVDVRESDKELNIEVELPGINPDDVELTAENGVLTIRGEKRGERKEGEEDNRYHLVERSYGGFMRSFQLPQGLDESKIEADFNNGILSVHIPKAALPQPRRIQIGNRTNTEQQHQVSEASADKGPATTQDRTRANRTSKSEPTKPADASVR